MLFFDFKQAYDSVIRVEPYEEMIALGIPNKLIKLVKMTLRKTDKIVKVGGELSNKFKVKKVTQAK